MSRFLPIREARAFAIALTGQILSIFGSSLTSFALGVWVYQSTGSVTRFALISLVTSLPGILLSPAAGALVDRFDRRHIMILSDCGTGLCGLGIAGLLAASALSPWRLYLLLAVTSITKAFQFPAFTASIPLLVPRRQLGRANGLAQMLVTAQTVAPLVAGLLLGWIGVIGILLLNVCTSVLCILTLLAVRIPRPEVRVASEKPVSVWQDTAYAWSYLQQRPALFDLLLLFALANFTLGMLQALLGPMVLSIASPAALGTVMSFAGAGMVLGTFAMSVWGGPQSRILGIFVALLIEGVVLCVGGLRPSLPLIATAAFFFLLCSPAINSCSQTIWQNKVALEVQGRVFAIRRVVALSSMPLAYALAGPLADRVFEPLLAPGGAWAGTVGRLVGVGKGRGIGLLFMVLGVLVILTVALASRSTRLRFVEDQLPDADFAPGLVAAGSVGGTETAT